MDCDVCGRDFDARRKPNCVSCTTAVLYQPRTQQVSALLEREKAHTHAEAIVRPGNDGILAALPEDADWDAIAAGVKHDSHEKQQAQLSTCEDRIAAILDTTEALKKQINEYKADIAKRKREYSQRRQDIASTRRELENRRLQIVEPVKRAIQKASSRLQKTQVRTSEARAYLCREVANLSRLNQSTRKRKDGRVRSDCFISGLYIPDLRDLNSAKPGQVSTTLDSICRLLGICCHYLSVRLPAEIILPRAGFPNVAILPEKYSYKGVDLPFPGFPGSSHSSPAASRLLEQKSLPRPRLLYLDRPLAKLYKDDIKAYGFFIEGVALLAWNIAWLCRCQGMGTVNTFEDACMIGNNLWRLLLGPNVSTGKRPELIRNISTATNVNTRSPGKTATASPAPVQFGVFSHASLPHNLASHAAQAIFDNHALPSATRLTDKLAKYLFTDMSGAEWELLEEREWNDEREDEEAVLIGGNRDEVQRKHPAMSVMTVAAHNDDTDDLSAEAAQDGKSGNKGWMKVRGRNHGV